MCGGGGRIIATRVVVGTRDGDGGGRYRRRRSSALEKNLNNFPLPSAAWRILLLRDARRRPSKPISRVMVTRTTKKTFFFLSLFLRTESGASSLRDAKLRNALAQSMWRGRRATRKGIFSCSVHSWILIQEWNGFQTMSVLFLSSKIGQKRSVEIFIDQKCCPTGNFKKGIFLIFNFISPILPAISVKSVIPINLTWTRRK